MKLVTVTKPDKGDKAMPKKFDNDVISPNCVVVVFQFIASLE